MDDSIKIAGTPAAVTKRRWRARTLAWMVAVIMLPAIGGGMFWAGWVLSSRGSAQLPLITTEGDFGHIALISPAESDLLAINGITGRKVPFLPASDMNILDPSGRFLFTSHESGTSAGVTRIDLETGDTAVLVSYLDHDFRNLDGLLWTAWGTLLVGEETPGGRLFEILDPMAQPGEAQFVERTAFGRRKHEGLAMDERGYLYGVDEANEGGIYRFRPDAPLTVDALSSGTLEVLVTEADLSELDRGRVAARWEPAETADPAGFNRPEDIEITRDTLYVALTGADQVISIDLADANNPTIGLFASSETNAPGLTWPDNLASDPDGNLYITENIGGSRFTGQRNQLWAAAAAGDPLAPAEKVELFATLNSPRDEFSGVLVDNTGDRLFVNVLGPDNFILMVPLSH
jgi:hypothetical protein